jgi:CubicO group peptidase (beta-lactamase class C family)
MNRHHEARVYELRTNRRRFLRQGGLALAALGMSHSFSSEVHAAAGLPIDQAFDDTVNAHMKARKTPGAALAVIKDRRLVYARGYGWADVDKKEAPQPDSLFRIASISKTFTGVAVIKLAAAGRLDLDAPAFALLQLAPLPGKEPDPRLDKITVRHLLHHTGGWDRDKSGDPMFMSEKIARANGEAPPANQHAIIRYMLGQPLDFDPGAQYAYSNFGYCVLGRIIEKITGYDYAEWLKHEVLMPIGIRDMRLGRSIASERAKGEVKYYMPDGETPSEPYTGFCLEAMDSHGGWLASAVDLARYAAALDDPARESWLLLKARRMLYEVPASPVSRGKNGSMEPTYYGCGWMVRRVGASGRANYWHTGSLPGTFTLLVRRYDGLAWAILFNQRSSDPKLPDRDIDAALHKAADSVAEWPEHDLFGKYS